MRLANCSSLFIWFGFCYKFAFETLGKRKHFYGNIYRTNRLNQNQNRIVNPINLNKVFSFHVLFVCVGNAAEEKKNTQIIFYQNQKWTYFFNHLISPPIWATLSLNGFLFAFVSLIAVFLHTCSISISSEHLKKKPTFVIIY